MITYSIRQCANSACNLRYPQVDGHPFGERCPRCASSTHTVLEGVLGQEPNSIRDNHIGIHLEAVFDNIRSAWNVGSMLRTADGVGIRKVYLCGVTPPADNPKVVKTSLGAEQSILWECHPNSVALGERLVEQGYTLIALEQHPHAQSIQEFAGFSLLKKYILVAGNEIIGVDPDLLRLCDHILEIPMLGRKRSFNVAVAFGIAVHYLSALK
jgi:tRNA G18 (ribose-2'-O)-methylase SpoU